MVWPPTGISVRTCLLPISSHVTKEDLLNPTLKGALELSDNNIKEKIADEKHEPESCLKIKFFQKYIILNEEE